MFKRWIDPSLFFSGGFEPGADEVHELETARNAELLVNVVYMIPDRMVGDKQLPLDVFVALSLEKEVEDFPLPNRQLKIIPELLHLRLGECLHADRLPETFQSFPQDQNRCDAGHKKAEWNSPPR